MDWTRLGWLAINWTAFLVMFAIVAWGVFQKGANGWWFVLPIFVGCLVNWPFTKSGDPGW